MEAVTDDTPGTQIHRIRTVCFVRGTRAPEDDICITRLVFQA